MDWVRLVQNRGVKMNWILLGICMMVLSVVVIGCKWLYKEPKTCRGVAYDKENKRKIIYSGHFGRDGRVIINESYVEKDETC